VQRNQLRSEHNGLIETLPLQLPGTCVESFDLPLTPELARSSSTVLIRDPLARSCRGLPDSTLRPLSVPSRPPVFSLEMAGAMRASTSPSRSGSEGPYPFPEDDEV
jgi:hypothetical protein